ncbi:hypothetical protein [Marinobacter xestospongiae]|uniref:hypothetical protein n=1 Tax=Marinobacter xestospongiae TaxID=994319 RepID=UPI0020054977|nr:hypothetical protein [Marinobacter xestospongiae]MCK7569086.1 hypothetical protein [Marinobacter xestospongiae]
MSHIPPRQEQVEDKERRFYVCAASSRYLQLQQEAIQRGTDLWTLGGAVLTAWLEAGCPDFGFSGSATPESSSSPPPSSSPLAHDQGD